MNNSHKSWLLILLIVLIFGNPLNVLASGYKMPKVHDCTIVSHKERLNSIALAMKKSFDSKQYADVIEMSQATNDEFDASALEMQKSLKEYVWESREKVFDFDALNLVSLALYWQARTFLELNDEEKAKEVAKKLINQYYYGQCYVEDSPFAKPAFDLDYDFEEFKDLWEKK